MEAYTNHRYNTNVEDSLALKAVRLIHDNLYAAYTDGSDMTARENLQIAALFAGRAFTRGSVGYVHAIGHTLGGLYGVPHGKAMAILLPHVMRAFGPAAHRRLAELADACGIRGRDEDMDQIIRWAVKEANPLYPTPVLWRKEDFRKFIESVRV